MSDRAFGVEIEFDSGGLGREGVLSVLREEFDRHEMRRWWFSDRLGWDGSEFELRTPILRGKEGFKKLEVVMNCLSDNGCDVTDGDGLHVHHDAPEFVNNINNCIRLVRSWRDNRHLIYDFVASYRHDYDGEYWACPKWTDEQFEELVTTKQIPGWERNDLNLTALLEHGSIEIRLHEGTLNYPEAEAWILFGQSFIERSLTQRMRDSETSANMLKKVEINPDAEKRLLDKARWGRRA